MIKITSLCLDDIVLFKDITNVCYTGKVVRLSHHAVAVKALDSGRVYDLAVSVLGGTVDAQLAHPKTMDKAWQETVDGLKASQRAQAKEIDSLRATLAQERSALAKATNRASGPFELRSVDISAVPDPRAVHYGRQVVTLKGSIARAARSDFWPHFENMEVSFYYDQLFETIGVDRPTAQKLAETQRVLSENSAVVARQAAEIEKLKKDNERCAKRLATVREALGSP